MADYWTWERCDPDFAAFLCEAPVVDALRRDRTEPFSFIAERWFGDDGKDLSLRRRFVAEAALGYWEAGDVEGWRRFARGASYTMLYGRGKDRLMLIEVRETPDDGGT